MSILSRDIQQSGQACEIVQTSLNKRTDRQRDGCGTLVSMKRHLNGGATMKVVILLFLS